MHRILFESLYHLISSHFTSLFLRIFVPRDLSQDPGRWQGRCQKRSTVYVNRIHDGLSIMRRHISFCSEHSVSVLLYHQVRYYFTSR